MSGARRGVAVIGAGVVVEQRHLPALLASGRGVPAAIFDPDRGRAQTLAERFSIPFVAESLAAAVAVDSAEAALIASPNSFHRAGVEAALARGLHVLCEKPMALNLPDARAMAEAGRAAGRTLRIGFAQRFSSEHRCAARLLESGVLGRVHAFHGVISEPIDVVPGGAANYRFNAAQGGGLTLIDVGSHRIDQTRALFGEVEEVYAEMASVLPGHDLDDSVSLSLRLRGGAVGTLAFHRFSRAYFSPWTVLGTKAVMNFSAAIVNPYQSAPLAVFLEEPPERALPPDLLPWTRPQGWWGETPAGWTSLWPPREDAFVRQWEAFFDAVDGRASGAATADDGCRALEIVLAAYESARTRKPVSLPLDSSVDPTPPSFERNLCQNPVGST